MIKVILTNKYEITGMALRFALECYPDIEVVGSAAHEESIFDLCSKKMPDVIIFELFNDTLEDLDVAKRIHEYYHDIRLIILSHLIELGSTELQEIGGSACIFMTTPLQELVSIIRGLVSKR